MNEEIKYKAYMHVTPNDKKQKSVMLFFYCTERR